MQESDREWERERSTNNDLLGKRTHFVLVHIKALYLSALIYFVIYACDTLVYVLLPSAPGESVSYEISQ